MKPTKDQVKDQVIEFLVQSNAIEGVYDEDSFLQAQEAWRFLIKQKKLTVGVILEVHKILMLNQNLAPDQKGYFRRCTVYIGGKVAVNWLKIPELLDQMILNINDVVENAKKESEIFKEKICKEHHVKYEHIHPFVDGNGRTGRMFMNWQRLKVGLPLLIIHEGEEQMNYYQWFK